MHQTFIKMFQNFQQILSSGFKKEIYKNMCFYSPHSQGEWKHCGFGVLDHSSGYILVKLIFHFGSTEQDTTFKTKTTTLQCCASEEQLFKVE
jgi:hypothetical protein